MPNLFLDKEGRWFHDGVEITHARTLRLFSRSLERSTDGKYYVHVDPESAEVIVEDTPYVVKSVTIQARSNGQPSGYILHLNDETDERLGSDALVVSGENVMYCKVKGGAERARFLRAAYYQICARLEYHEGEDRYWLPCGDREISIQSDDRARG